VLRSVIISIRITQIKIIEFYSEKWNQTLNNTLNIKIKEALDNASISWNLNQVLYDRLKYIKIEGPSRLGGINIAKGIEVGAYTYLHNGFLFNVKIGRYCSIGRDFNCLQPNHTVEFLSTSPVFSDGDQVVGCTANNSVFKGKTIDKTLKRGCTFIGNDVWIGTGVTILYGVEVGDGAVIGAGSVVTKDIKPYSIVAGNPAKLVRFRFDENTIKKLIEIKWWNFSPEHLKNIRFENIDASLLDFSEHNTIKKFKPMIFVK